MSKSTALEQYTQALLDDCGYETQHGMLEDYAYKSVVPGVCKDVDCLAVTDVEPDQDKGWCEICSAPTVKSCLMIWGLI